MYDHTKNSTRTQQPPAVARASNGLQYLTERGISNEAITAFGIRSVPGGVSFPYDPANPGARGVKYAVPAEHAGQKYSWAGKPAQAKYYYPPQLAYAVERARGVVWLASGQPDTWTMYTVGFHNVFSFYGEMNIPTDVVDFLCSLGVNTVRYPPDRDNTGLMAARKLTAMLDGSGICLELLQLPDNIHDLNDLWRSVNFARVKFILALNALPPLNLPAEAQTAPPPPAQHVRSDNDNNTTLQDLKNTVAAVLHVDSYRANGFSTKNVKCPVCEDTPERPSAGWHQSGYLHCFQCGTVLNTYESAVALGIDLQPSHSRRRSEFTQLPTSVREHLIRVGQTIVARVLDCLYSHFSPGVTLTIPQVADLLATCGISQSSAYRACNYIREHLNYQNAPPLPPPSGVGAGSRFGEQQKSQNAPPTPVRSGARFAESFSNISSEQRQGDLNSCQNLPPYSFIPNCIPAHSDKNSVRKRGRKARTFYLPTADEVCSLLAVEARGYDVLPAAALRGNGVYKAHLHRALFRNRPGVYTRAWLGARLGVSGRTTRNWEKRYPELADIVVTPNRTVQPLTHEIIAKLPVNRAACRRARSRYIYIETPDARHFPTQAAALAAVNKHGFANVTIVSSAPNTYTVAPVPDARTTQEPSVPVTHAAPEREPASNGAAPTESAPPPQTPQPEPTTSWSPFPPMPAGKSARHYYELEDDPRVCRLRP